jgi:hypothetical protein
LADTVQHHPGVTTVAANADYNQLAETMIPFTGNVVMFPALRKEKDPLLSGGQSCNQRINLLYRTE